MSNSTSGRVYRLCQKELRESLRDRRTIITLVLMPLLVYPLLSMILQRLLITTAPKSEADILRVGVENPALKGPLEETIAFGKHILAVRGAQTLSIERSDAPPSLLSGEKASQQIAVQQILAQDIEMFLIERDGRAALQAGAIDILIRGDATGQFGALDKPPSGEPSGSSGGEITEAATGPTSPEATLEPDADNRADRNRPRMRAQVIRDILNELPEDRYSIEYVPNDRHSEWAIHLFRSIFAAVNEEVAASLVRVAGADYHPTISMSAAPIKITSSTQTTLASLVPLVLVLMTIAGAVYPAIDLTAGERERGTLEAMIVSPTPRYLLLLAKYVAVVTVALLTAIANLTAMSITLWASGLGRIFFGGGGLSLLTMFQILCLLVLFAMFFSAVLLSITSFAKSFKEAQAYLIPVMLVSLAPGVLSLLPQVRLTNVLSAVPLANIVLLSRDVLVGSATRESAVISVVCTVVYAIAAIAVASRLFGSDASLQGSQGSWRDLFRRPELPTALPTVDQMALTMACLFPLYFVASTTLPALGGLLEYRLIMAAIVSWILIFGLPTIVAYYRRLDFRQTFLLSSGRVSTWLLALPAVLLLASSLWMFSHELMIFSKQLGMATFTDEQLKQAQAFAEKLPEIPLSLLLFCFAITPAICEEWFFRGFVMSSLRRMGSAAAVIGSATLFALMHVLTSNMLSLERFLPSMFMGLALGWVAWRTGVLWPGVVLHACHNGLLLSVGHFKEQLKGLGIGLEEGEHLPSLWLGGAILATLVGVGLITLVKRRDAFATDV